MKLFLIIVGALVTAFVLCLVIFVLWLRWLMRKVRGSFEDLGGNEKCPAMRTLCFLLTRADLDCGAGAWSTRASPTSGAQRLPAWVALVRLLPAA